MKCLPGRVLHLLVISLTVAAGDTIDRARSIRDGSTLVSAGGSFELGFFSPGGSKKRYVGIWFRNVPAGNVVWVANRRAPLNDSTGVLRFAEPGNLVIQDKAGGIVWESSSAATGASNPVAQLLETGNLVIRDGDAGNGSNSSYIWQSFDEPGNTMIAGMRLGVDRRRGLSWQLTSWRSADDPSPGNYTFRLDARVLPQLVLLQGATVTYGTGPWNGICFSGIPDTLSADIFRNFFVSDQDAAYYSFESTGRNNTHTTVVVQPSGVAQRLVWSARTSTWNVFLSGPVEECDAFAVCGPYGVCNVSSTPICQCPRGFRPRSPQDWNLRYTSGGCVREDGLQCGGGDGFLRLRQVKLPDVTKATVDIISVGLDKCRDRCARNCSCAAYSRAVIGQRVSGCATWSGELVDIRTVPNGPEDFYLRVPAAALDPATAEPRDNKSKRTRLVVATSVASVILLLITLCSCGIWMKIRMNKKKTSMKALTTANGDKRKHYHSTSARIVGEDPELPLLDFETIASATDNFSLSNKVGEGGFGAVYKAILDDGQEAAVKRLSGISMQGTNEFMNEAKLIAKLQHKNLVRLLGCCIQGEERILIYEYMQNKSLDSFIFDEHKRALLDWTTRLDIILGVAKGLMYLHHDSRYKIIHRDLKASNILLDGAMNPKISDFGTARIFGADQNVEKTKRVIGTYGYMSPEYALNGTISVKSDVFSFGVLTLEVLSGAKNRGIYQNELHLNLLSHAWKLWMEDKYLEFLDPTIDSSYDIIQIARYIQVALLCVQEHATDRPSMSTVVMMLASENIPLPQPKGPGFLVFTSCNLTDQASSGKQVFTENEITITIVEGR